MPPAESYLRRPGDSEFRAFKFDVLCTEDGVIADITTFGRRAVPGLRPTADTCEASGQRTESCRRRCTSDHRVWTQHP
jgi:RNA polymerase sigma-70 factor (ECF subfamily)